MQLSLTDSGTENFSSRVPARSHESNIAVLSEIGEEVVEGKALLRA
jgi:hypothetical protein